MLEKVYVEQEIFNRYLKSIRIGNKPDKQRKTLANVSMPFNGRNNTIKFFNDYTSIVHEA